MTRSVILSGAKNLTRSVIANEVKSRFIGTTSRFSTGTRNDICRHGFNRAGFFGPLAQSVEQLPLKQEVGGSIPPWPTCRGGEIGIHARLRT